ncbi:hypothetical protein ACOSQ4_016554 [Xanthoceras sorbifolium]
MDSIYSLVFIVFSIMYVMVCCYICQAFNPRIGFLTGGGTSIMCSLLFDFNSLEISIFFFQLVSVEIYMKFVVEE